MTTASDTHIVAGLTGSFKVEAMSGQELQREREYVVVQLNQPDPGWTYGVRFLNMTSGKPSRIVFGRNLDDLHRAIDPHVGASGLTSRRVVVAIFSLIMTFLTVNAASVMWWMTGVAWLWVGLTAAAVLVEAVRPLVFERHFLRVFPGHHYELARRVFVRATLALVMLVALLWVVQPLL